MFKLMGPDGQYYESKAKGSLGGYNGRVKIYGKLDCPSAMMWIKKGYYVNHRVFFKNEEDAVLAGFRPCAVCMQQQYMKWKESPENFINEVLSSNNDEKEM